MTEKVMIYTRVQGAISSFLGSMFTEPQGSGGLRDGDYTHDGETDMFKQTPGSGAFRIDSRPLFPL